MKKIFFLIIIFPIFLFSQAEEENPYDPTNFKGITSTTKLDDIDNINLFNGNINISIPLGPSYQIGPLLNSQINLIYNSKIWKSIHFQYQLSEDAQCPPDTQYAEVVTKTKFLKIYFNI